MTKVEKLTEKEIEQKLDILNEQAESSLNELFLGKIIQGKPWEKEHFERTLHTVVDIAIENSDITDFDIQTGIEGHILSMNIRDGQDNTVADVIYSITRVGGAYQVDRVMVAYKIGAFVSENEVIVDELPF